MARRKLAPATTRTEICFDDIVKINNLIYDSEQWLQKNDNSMKSDYDKIIKEFENIFYPFMECIYNMSDDCQHNTNNVSKNRFLSYWHLFGMTSA